MELERDAAHIREEGDEGSVPAEKGVWGDDPGDHGKSASPHGLGLESEAAALGVCEPEPAA